MTSPLPCVVLKKGREHSVLNRHPWIFSGAIEEPSRWCISPKCTIGAATPRGCISPKCTTGKELSSSSEAHFGEMRPQAMGETVEVVSASGETLGYGSYSPASQIRVRMLSFADGASEGRRTTDCRRIPDAERLRVYEASHLPVDAKARRVIAKSIPDAAYIEELVAAAIGRRADFFVRGETNAMRLVNAENDGLPGVVVDFYAGFAVCQFTSAGAEFWKDTIVSAVMKFAPGCRGVSERTDLKDRVKEGLARCASASDAPLPEGRAALRVGARAEREGSAFRVLAGEEPPELIEIFEGSASPVGAFRRNAPGGALGQECPFSVRFLIDVRHGHKTGFYLDQRDARAAVGALANGADVLNCFCYTGGFGLACAACGALSVTQVDVSAEALALAKKNEMLQHACGTKFVYACEDVFQYLRSCRDARKTFDLIVLDPPKFAETKSQVMKAARGYKDINLLAMKLLRPGGILATFSCSGAMTSDLFDRILAEAAVDAKRDFQVIGRTRQGADHPVALSFPEGWYLKGVLLRAV